MKKKQIIEKDGVQYEVVRIVKNASEKQQVIVNTWNLTKYEKWYDTEYCLEAVKQDGDSLQYVNKYVFIKKEEVKSPLNRGRNGI